MGLGMDPHRFYMGAYKDTTKVRMLMEPSSAAQASIHFLGADPGGRLEPRRFAEEVLAFASRSLNATEARCSARVGGGLGLGGVSSPWSRGQNCKGISLGRHLLSFRDIPSIAPNLKGLLLVECFGPGPAVWELLLRMTPCQNSLLRSVSGRFPRPQTPKVWGSSSSPYP